MKYKSILFNKILIRVIFYIYLTVKRMRTDEVCHPKDFKEQGSSSSKSSRKQRSRLSNPNGKSAFIWTSDDDDFE